MSTCYSNIKSWAGVLFEDGGTSIFQTSGCANAIAAVSPEQAWLGDFNASQLTLVTIDGGSDSIGESMRVNQLFLSQSELIAVGLADALYNSPGMLVRYRRQGF